MNYGLTSKGFKKKRYRDIIQDMEDHARQLYGENINLSPRSPLGIFVRLMAWNASIVWEALEDTYNSGFIDTATDRDLDKVVKYVGIQRRAAVPASGEVEFEGEEGIEVPENFLVETEDGVQFFTAESINIDGPTKCPVEAIEPGVAGNVQPGTITEITNPLPGLDSVNNPEETSGGLDTETDPELRDRYMESVAIAGGSTVHGILGRLLDTDGVRGAEVRMNTNMDDKLDGPWTLPPKSVHCIVLGGEDEDVADTIFEAKPAGIESFGDESVMVLDLSGHYHGINFSRAEVVEVELDVSIWTDEEFPEDGKDKIKKALIQYIGGEDEEGNIYAGLNLGKYVKNSQMIKEIYRAVDGIRDVEVEITSPTPVSSGNLPVELHQVAETKHNLINITEE